MYLTRLVAAQAVLAALVAPGAVSAAEPLPTEEKYLYADVNVIEVLAGRETFQVTYRCAASARVLVASTGVTCGITTMQSLFLPGPYTTFVRTEQVTAGAFAVQLAGTAVFTDGTIFTTSCSTDTAREPLKYAACGRWQ